MTTTADGSNHPWPANVAPPLIVAGMHRSGTSFVASLLREAGIDMGSRLMPAGPSNVRGHFENLDFVEFHMRALSRLGFDDSGWIASDCLRLDEDSISEAGALVAGNGRSAPWGWKDPRTTLFVEFWKRVVPDARYVFLYREPAEVIDSLFRRGDTPIKNAPALASEAWRTHNAIILRFVQQNRARCVLANIASVADRPQAFLYMLAERFHLDIDIAARSPFEAQLMRRLEPGRPEPILLRHFNPELATLFSALEAAADIPGDSSVEMLTPPEDVFFQAWATAQQTQLDPCSIPPDGTGAGGEEQVLWTTELIDLVSKVNQELAEYKAALSEFADAAAID